jgi:hypothetical protein
MEKLVNYSKTLFIPDIHAPFQDELAISALKDFIKWFKPDDVIYLGDVVDFYAISHFLKDPERALKLQDEIDEAKYIINDINRATPKSKKWFIKGNHEARLQKYLWSEAKELASLRSLQLDSLMEFKKQNLTYIKEGRMNYKGLLVKHGGVVRKFTGYTAKAEYEKNGVSGISAHTHRLGAYRHNNDGGAYIWVESGCICRTDQEYLDGETPNWQEGWVIGYFKNNSKRYHLETVPYVDKKAMYGGIEFV